MPLRNTLSLYAYNPVTGTKANYGDAITDLSFSTIVPGGFGDLKCTLMMPDSRIVPQELAIFNRVALTDGTTSAFLGRLDEPAMQVDNTGTQFTLSCMGGSHSLSDDPDDYSYTNAQALAILQDQFTQRSARLQIDSDQSLVLADNPTFTNGFTESYSGKTLEEILNDICGIIAGTTATNQNGYVWAVWDHKTHRDSAGFPTWQLSVIPRDITTVAYQALSSDIQQWTITPSVEYAYNCANVLFRDTNNNGAPSNVVVTDGRLGTNGAQGSAPFPFRRIRKDLSSAQLTSGEASNLANALLTQYKNGGYKVQVILTSVSDVTGTPIPLHTVRAGQNIFLPELATSGRQLATAPTPNTNLFFITETQYQESAGAAPQLTISASSFNDTAAFQIARLQYIAQHQKADTAKHDNIAGLGEIQSGSLGINWGNGTAGGDIAGCTVVFPLTFRGTPTVTVTITSSSNMGSYAVANVTAGGFVFRAAASINGGGFAYGTWTAKY